MAITKAIKGAVVSPDEIASSFPDSQDALNQLTDQGIISPRDGGQKFEFLQDFDVASFTPKENNITTNPGETSGGGSSASDVFGFLQNFIGGDTETVTQDSETGKEILKQEQEATDANKESQFAQLDDALAKELQTVEQEGNQVRGETKNKLAELGILGNSTAGVQYLTDLETSINKLKTETRTKYELSKLDIDAKLKAQLIANVDSRIKAINDSIKEKKDQLLEVGKLGVSLFKELNTAEQDRIKNQLEADKNRIQEEYNQGKLTIDEFNAQTNAIEAQIKSFEADTNRFEAETARMKEEREAGAGRPSFAEFLAGIGEQTGQTIDPDNPEIQALYNQAFPLTVNEAKKNLTTEQQSRAEVVQDMIDKNELSLEEAQQVHSDIAWMFHRPGLSSLERMFFSIPQIDTSGGNTN